MFAYFNFNEDFRHLARYDGRTLGSPPLPLSALCSCILASRLSETTANRARLMLAASARCALLFLKAVSERILTARFRSRTRNISIMQCCPLMKTSDTKEGVVFNEQPNAVRERFSKEDIASVMGDSNATLGYDNTLLDGNDNGVSFAIAVSSTVWPLVAYYSST